MTEYGDFMRKQRELEMERESEDYEENGFEQFCLGVAVSATIAVTVFWGFVLFSWGSHFFGN